MAYSMTFQSALAAPPARVWQWITSADGIAAEMSPWLRMSTPRQETQASLLAGFAPGVPLFRSRISLFGLLPVDYSDLTLTSLDEGSGFVEQSPMGSMSLWRHERRITPQTGGGCLLTDTLTFRPRFGGRIAAGIVEAFFSHRHQVLRRRLGQA